MGPNNIAAIFSPASETLSPEILIPTIAMFALYSKVTENIAIAGEMNKTQNLTNDSEDKVSTEIAIAIVEKSQHLAHSAHHPDVTAALTLLLT